MRMMVRAVCTGYSSLLRVLRGFVRAFFQVISPVAQGGANPHPNDHKSQARPTRDSRYRAKFVRGSLYDIGRARPPVLVFGAPSPF
jgi:hypothetical protein